MVNPDSLIVTIEEIPDNITLVELVGEINTICSGDLRKLVDNLVGTGRTRVILDLQGVTYLNSRALGIIVSSVSEMKRTGGDLMMCCLSPAVIQLFEITRLFDVFQVFDTVEEAIQAYGKT